MSDGHSILIHSNSSILTLPLTTTRNLSGYLLMNLYYGLSEHGSARGDRLSKPIDTPREPDYYQALKLFLQQDVPLFQRVLELVRSWNVEVSDSHPNIERDVVEISTILKRSPTMVRDLNAILPKGFAVQCPTTDIVSVEYFVLITSSGGQILSTSGIKVPSPSSTIELRVLLPLKDRWESIARESILNPQWGGCADLDMQEFYDSKIDDDYKRCVLRRQVHLVKQTGCLPPSLFLNHVVIPEGNYHASCGNFADIAKANINGISVCLKILRVNKDDYDKKEKEFRRELVLWSRLNHPNILPFLGASTKGSRFILISPWMENGNLRQFLKSHPEHNRLKACFEISSGLDYLHRLSPPIFHHDIKAANILITNDGQCGLADFGLSSIDGSQRLQSKSYAGEGTRRWQPPEVVLDSPESCVKLIPRAIDVYAFGCTVLEQLRVLKVFTGDYPFANFKSEYTFIRALEEKKKPELPDAEILGLPDKLRSLFYSCWDAAPAARPTMRQINFELKEELDSRDGSGLNPMETSQLANGETVIGSSDSEFDVHTMLSPPNNGQGAQFSFGRATLTKDDYYIGSKIRVPYLYSESGSSSASTTNSGGLLTPQSKGNDSPPTTRFSVASPEAAFSDESIAIASAARAQVVFGTMTPPQTPTRSLSQNSVQVSPILHAQPSLFTQGLAEITCRAHRLNLDAPVFEPSFLRQPDVKPRPPPSSPPILLRAPFLNEPLLEGYDGDIAEVLEETKDARFDPLRASGTSDILTPPETPIRSPSHSNIPLSPLSLTLSSRLSPAAQIFVPRPAMSAKASTHRLNLDAPVFQPSSSRSSRAHRPSLDAQAPVFKPSSN